MVQYLPVSAKIVGSIAMFIFKVLAYPNTSTQSAALSSAIQQAIFQKLGGKLGLT